MDRTGRGVWNVGANIGAMSLLARIVAPTGTVIAHRAGGLGRRRFFAT